MHGDLVQFTPIILYSINESTEKKSTSISRVAIEIYMSY